MTFNDCKIMGVINITSDSFYSHSRAQGIDSALRMADDMIKEGGDILDIGGEATNPNLDVTETQVSLEKEMDRVIPVIEAINNRFDVPISIDTSKPAIMKEAVKVGASMINDQRALTMPGAIEAAVELKVPVCLMHMYGLNKREPRTCNLQETLNEIKDYLLKRVNDCCELGILKENIIIDPGVGAANYGKSTNESLFILKELKQLVDTGYPVLVGYSNKSIIGEALNKPLEQRVGGSVACALLAAERGCSIVRVHNVGQTADALKILQATLSA